jgi:hypothetical protein
MIKDDTRVKIEGKGFKENKASPGKQFKKTPISTSV